MEIRIDGSPCPEHIQKMMSLPSVLRARARLRRDIAAQDKAEGDAWAMHRNLQVAADLEGRAYALEGR